MKFLLIVLVSSLGPFFGQADLFEGGVAKKEDVAYHVGLILYNTIDIGWCGGTIISDSYILTAAHCVDSLHKGVEVIIGAHNRSDSNEIGYEKLYVNASNVRIHPRWNKYTSAFDIAVLPLPQPIVLSDYKVAVELPKKQEGSYPTYANEKAYISGWANGSSKPVLNELLAYNIVDVVPDLVCSIAYVFKSNEKNICMKPPLTHFYCPGDSGGPLVLDTRPPTLIGISSFGSKYSCDLGLPYVFTRVSSHVNWIRKVTGIN